VLLFSFGLVIVNLAVDLLYTVLDRGSALDRRAHHHGSRYRNAGAGSADLFAPVSRDAALGICATPSRNRHRGALVLAMAGDRAVAPWLGTVDPTAARAVAAHSEPSAAFWLAATCWDATSIPASSTARGIAHGRLFGRDPGSLAGLRSALVSGFIRSVDSIIMRVMDG